MFFTEQDRTLVSSRVAKYQSQTAENVTVITADDIVATNAHTLADVLYNVPGILVDLRGGPGSQVGTVVQGAGLNHVRIVIDGVTLNSLSGSTYDIASIPVQQIQRVEIIKGPASSAWGAALGGVINIVTKEPVAEGSVASTLYGAGGERHFIDTRGELSATSGATGVYLTAGTLKHDGFTPANDTDLRRGYAKVVHSLADGGTLRLVASGDENIRQDGSIPPPYGGFSLGSYLSNFYTALLYDRPVSERGTLSLNLRSSGQEYQQSYYLLTDGEPFFWSDTSERSYGATISGSWQQGRHLFALGGDADHGEMTLRMPAAGQDFRRVFDRGGIYLSDTIDLGRLSLSPAIRFDTVSSIGDYISPSLGFTWQMFPQLIFRAQAARGFSQPNSTDAYRLEKVESYQAGVESSALEFMTLKGTLFRHNVSDAVVFTKALSVTEMIDLRRQGVEIEGESAPFWHTTLLAGYSWLDIRNRQTHEKVQFTPNYTVDIGLRHHRPHVLTVDLRGRYLRYHYDRPLRGSYDDIIWDMTVTRPYRLGPRATVDVFFSLHNLTDGEQHVQSLYSNPGRWVEGGVRYAF
jgi:vitamin B12 transporter